MRRGIRWASGEIAAIGLLMAVAAILAPGAGAQPEGPEWSLIQKAVECRDSEDWSGALKALDGLPENLDAWPAKRRDAIRKTVLRRAAVKTADSGLCEEAMAALSQEMAQAEETGTTVTPNMPPVVVSVLRARKAQAPKDQIAALSDALAKARPDTALRAEIMARLDAIPTGALAQERDRLALFAVLTAATERRDWQKFDALVGVARDLNWMEAQYLEIWSSLTRGRFEETIKLAKQYRATMVPDAVRGGYHRETYLWADVMRWRAEKALGQSAQAAATAARIKAEWPESAWAKAVGE